MKTFIFVREISRKYPVLLISSTLLALAVTAIEACTIFTISPLIDLLIHPDLQNISTLTSKTLKVIEFFGISPKLTNCLVLFVVFIVLSSLLRILLRYWIVNAKFTVVRDVMGNAFTDFFNARWYFFSSSKQGTLLNTFVCEIGRIGDAFSTMANLFASFLPLIFYLAISFYLSWQVTLISLVTTLLFSLPFAAVGKISYRLGKATTQALNKTISVLHESFTLAKTVLGFGNQKKAVKNLFSAFDVQRKNAVKSQTIGFSIPILYRPLGAIVLMVALFSARYFEVPVSEIAVIWWHCYRWSLA